MFDTYTHLKDPSEIEKIEKVCKDQFNVDLNVKGILIGNANTSKNSHTTVFKTNHGNIYALCVSDAPMMLADMASIIKSMGMKADTFLPPNGDKEYFEQAGSNIFQTVFPSHKMPQNTETSYYQTLSKYNPALVRISRIDGEIRQYNDQLRRWSKVLELSYTRMQVR